MKIGRIGNNYGNIVTNGKIIINGKEYTGKNISIINNKVMIDGKEYQEEEKEIHITIHGDVESLDIDYCSEISIHGNAKTVKTMSGDVECNIVEGNVSTMSGNVIAKEIRGDVNTMSGNIIGK
ncbi:hypothetical protein HMPREF1049_0118 [Fusobacterium necrophorum subsp. funduliforme ATCC 51357]|uniref:hypothetical protein n=1 Tax=Fusobacterium necrophorum TaxID=859 RepID=UPI00025E5A87|nr:hypothetical protein [Fusobacterium necrophorum]EIJ72005.1 hypothetical protein HMPREF1049_0118 [Fusobacterium necrophorum subsp. funduliforme ATCC 51357]KAB0553527.1 hypothetical protein F7P76_04205 [Fusobacterium necrophorum subsp. funduliforme]KYM54854.1 hypothetical protein A2U07_03425 [Fusobacterium necrophorum subsp. funduliforme]MDK4473555.1 hypothetical protein [Fusobacterium necrophorum]MDY2573180.1 hypothetical protein [Fusobacterium necrophorum]